MPDANIITAANMVITKTKKNRFVSTVFPPENQDSFSVGAQD
jgi:hypothetical protein